MPSRREILDCLTRARLIELASAGGITGLAARPKDEIIDALAAPIVARKLVTRDVLDALTRDELKAICRRFDLDDSGREKAPLVDRILASAASGSSAPSASASSGPSPRAAAVPASPGPGSPAAGSSRAPRLARKPVEQYEHKDKKRVNNPPVGLVTKDTEPTPEASPRKTYAYDPNLDPRLDWAGRAERLSFEVPTVSLHVHERIDPHTIIEAVKRTNGHDPEGGQMPLFESPAENRPLREAIDFYKHEHNWANRLIAGDSLLVMNSLLEKEGMAGKVQMVYIDPPYGIKYGSNFQPFVNKRDVQEGKDEDLTQEPEMIKAFRDTWELGIHSYLTYLRDRLFLAKDLLHESGSCFVQIGSANVHLVRALLDEVFGPSNFIASVAFVKTSGSTRDYLSATFDHLLFYARSRDQLKYRPIFLDKEAGGKGASGYIHLELSDGTRRKMTADERTGQQTLPHGARIYCLDNLTSQSVGRQKGVGASCWFPITIDGVEYLPSTQARWKTNEDGMARLQAANRLQVNGSSVGYVRYLDDFPAFPISDLWDDVMASFMADKVYVVQTMPKVIQRCMLMTTDPGDLVFDPTCGSGSTSVVAEQWGRRWITCDTSRVAITLAKQRLLTQVYDYYKIANPPMGVDSGFRYKMVPHVTLRSIAHNPELNKGMSRKAIDAAILRHADQEQLYDQPEIDASKARVTGPFTVEAVPAPVVRPIGEIEEPPASDQSIARSGATLRTRDWRDELLKTGVRGRGGQRILFTRVESLPGTRWLHADAETRPPEGSREAPQRVVVSFGQEHAPLEQKQVELAWEEARTLNPKPAAVLFAAFQFDPEAAKDIDELTPDKTGMVFLKIQMNTDLLTEDLKKKRSSNESFWLIGQPDVDVRRIQTGPDTGKWEVQVRGFDYYNTKTGAIESGDTGKIALWMLDTDYDGRSLYPRQVFLPMAGEKEGWAKLARNLKAEIDEDLIESYRGTVSLPFDLGRNKRVAVKIVDDRGIESLKIITIESSR